jgi:hypothetical protein
MGLSICSDEAGSSTLERRSISLVSSSSTTPDRVYVRLEWCGSLRLSVWGMEHRGLRSEVVEAVVPARRPAGGRAAAVTGIERDLRRGVRLDEPVLVG